MRKHRHRDNTTSTTKETVDATLTTTEKWVQTNRFKNNDKVCTRCEWVGDEWMVREVEDDAKKKEDTKGNYSIFFYDY